MISSKRMKKIGLSMVATLVCATASNIQAENTKPNIVFFLVDDFGWGALSGMGSQFHETPNIDKLAESGMSFSNGYAACTVCSPSRAAILTGCYPGRTRLTDWITGWKKPYAKLSVPDWKMYIDHERILLPEALKESGYATRFIGKWHLLPENKKELMKDHYPDSHGFDENIGGREWGKPQGKGKYFHPFNMPNVTSKKGDFLTDRLTDYAVEFIDQHQNDPFFLYFSYYTVHTPIMGKPELVAKYEAKKKTGQFKQKHPAYAAMVQSLDESVGRVLDKLEATGQAGNTIVIFTGDNGANSNKYSGGLRGSKAWSHEGGVREPFFIKGPGIQPGSTSDVPVIAIDLYPTLLDLIGAPLKPEQHKDGVSLKPLLRAEGDLPTRSLFWHYPHYHKTKPYGSIRNGEYKLIEFFEEGHLELYNIKDDMAEENNLAESMSEKAAEMLKEMQAWRISVDAQMMTPNPQYDPDHENKGRKSAGQKPASPTGNAGQSDAGVHKSVKGTKAFSSQLPANPAANAVDNNHVTRWAASGGTFPQWLEVEYTQAEKAKGVTITFRKQTVIKYKVDVQNKNGEWSTVVDQSENTNVVKTVDHDFNAEVTKLKVTVLATKNGWASISEIKLN